MFAGLWYVFQAQYDFLTFCYLRLRSGQPKYIVICLSTKCKWLFLKPKMFLLGLTRQGWKYWELQQKQAVTWLPFLVSSQVFSNMFMCQRCIGYFLPTLETFLTENTSVFYQFLLQLWQQLQKVLSIILNNTLPVCIRPHTITIQPSINHNIIS